MKLIKNLEMRKEKTSECTNKWGLFLCPYCSKEVEKRKSDGLKYKSCGCMQHELSNKTRTTHGAAREGKKEKLYSVWKDMRYRCYKKNDPAYKYYGGRGIKICDIWEKSYPVFKEWALSHGYKEGLTIDRRNNDGNYEPSNCRWVTQAVNNQNKKTTKLNWLTVRLIRALRDDGYKRQELFKIFDIKPGTLNSVIYNRTWKE